jgi:CheY-like chemotaxis protein
MPRKKILIVEDERINRELLNIFLQKKYALTFSDRLELATQFIDEEVYHLIITDIRLSNKMDGISVLKYARNSVNNGATPVVAYTASQTSHNQKSFAEEGFNGFIAKPIREVDLLKKVEDLLA